MNGKQSVQSWVRALTLPLTLVLLFKPVSLGFFLGKGELLTRGLKGLGNSAFKCLARCQILSKCPRSFLEP